MSNSDLWIFGEDGCLQKFDAEHCQVDRSRSAHSRNKFVGSDNFRDVCHSSDLHRKVLGEFNVLTTKKESIATMFRKGFGVLSVKPIKRLKCTTSPSGLEATTSSQCHNNDVQRDRSSFGHQPEVHDVLPETQLMSTCAQTDTGPPSTSQRSLKCSENSPKPNTLDETPEVHDTLLETQLMSTCAQIDKGPPSTSQRSLKCSENSPKPNTSHDMPEVHVTLPETQLMSTCAQTDMDPPSDETPEIDLSTSSVFQQESSVLTFAEDEPTGSVSDEMVDKSCMFSERVDVSTATDQEPTMADLAVTRIHTSDPKCSSERDMTSVIGSHATCSQMSLLANENSLIKYLTEVSYTTKLMSTCIQTDADTPSNLLTQTYVQTEADPLSKSLSSVCIQTEASPPSNSRQCSEGTQTESKVKRKRKKAHKSKHLKQRLKEVPKTTTSLTKSASVNSLVHNQSTESLIADENRIRTESANGIQYPSSRPESEVRIKTEPLSNDEFSAAILGNTVGIKSEPFEGDDEYASAMWQNKNDLSKLPESCHTCMHSLSKPKTGTSLTDGAIKTSKPTPENLSLNVMSSGLYSNVSLEKPSDTQRLQQRVEQTAPQPIPMVTALQPEPPLPIRISSVFSLKSHDNNMSIQDIASMHQHDKGVSVSERTLNSGKDSAGYSNSKNLNAIKFPEDLKSDPCLHSLCRVVLENIQMKNGQVVDSKCTKICRQRFLSTKRRCDITRKKRNRTNTSTSYLSGTPHLMTGPRFNSVDVNSTISRSSLPDSTGRHALCRVIVPPVGLAPQAPCTASGPAIRRFDGMQLPNGFTNKKRFYMFKVQGRNIVIPSVSLNNPRIISYQTLKRLRPQSFPGMQLKMSSSGYRSSNSSPVPSLSIKTEPTT